MASQYTASGRSDMSAGKTVLFTPDEFAALVGVFAGAALVDWEAYDRARDKILQEGYATGLLSTPIARPPAVSKPTQRGS
jgi:hypothetical protein